MTERMVVVGGDAAGMSAASQAKRLAGDKLEVLAFERRGPQLSRPAASPTGLSSDVGDGEQLVLVTPEAHQANGIDLRMLTDVEAIDLQAGTVMIRDLAAGRHYREGSTTSFSPPARSRCGCPLRRRRHRCLQRPDPGRRRRRSWPAWSGSGPSVRW